MTKKDQPTLDRWDMIAGPQEVRETKESVMPMTPSGEELIKSSEQARHDGDATQLLVLVRRNADNLAQLRSLREELHLEHEGRHDARSQLRTTRCLATFLLVAIVVASCTGTLHMGFKFNNSRKNGLGIVLSQPPANTVPEKAVATMNAAQAANETPYAESEPKELFSSPEAISQKVICAIDEHREQWKLGIRGSPSDLWLTWEADRFTAVFSVWDGKWKLNFIDLTQRFPQEKGIDIGMTLNAQASSALTSLQKSLMASKTSDPLVRAAIDNFMR